MFPWILCVLLAVVCIVLTVKLYLMRKSMQEICDCVRLHLSTDTNLNVRISSKDKYVCRLALEMEKQLSQLRKLQLEYRSGNQELKDSITNISHDLRTPLTAICGYLDLLEKAELSTDVARYISHIRNRSEAMKELTEELFRYSIITSVPEIRCQRVDMARSLEESLLNMEGDFCTAHIEPQISLPRASVWKNLDPMALQRIYSNIISNAIKYSDGDFSVSLTEDGTVTFSNHAKGMTAVEVGKLFDRFYTVESARKSTGLGLAIAKLLTEQMGGTICADYQNGNLKIILAF